MLRRLVLSKVYSRRTAVDTASIYITWFKLSDFVMSCNNPLPCLVWPGTVLLHKMI